MKREIFIVVPVYNEAAVLDEVLREIMASGPYRVLVVDDGSSDDSYEVASAIEGVIALRHKINRGKGAAVKTGFAAANELGADCIVTMDGDGQHDPEDIKALITPILEKKFDIVLGTRLKQSKGMPFTKVIANKIGNLVTLCFYGIYVSDSQSGFRAYSKFAANIIDTKADKYEYDSKVLREINNNRLSFIEVPIAVKYTKHSMSKPRKQGFFTGIKTMVRMVWDMLV